MIIAISYLKGTLGIIVKYRSYKYDRMLETSFTGGRLRYERRNFMLMTCQYPDLGSASDWSCCVGSLLQSKSYWKNYQNYWIDGIGSSWVLNIWILSEFRYFYGFLVSLHNGFLVYLLTRFSGRLEINFSRLLQIKETFSRLIQINRISGMADETNEVAR